MTALLICLNFVIGPVQMLKLCDSYWEWGYLRRGLTPLDRDYGLINNIYHDIGTHVIHHHHLFPQIPHYHLVEATEAVKPVLGKYYRDPDKSGSLPLHVLGILAKSMKEDHYVSDEGDVVYFQADLNLYEETKVLQVNRKGIYFVAAPDHSLIRHCELEPRASSTCRSL